MKVKKEKKVAKKSVSKLKKQADKVFSEYIRRRDNGVCATCGTVRQWKEMQNGHYVSRSHNSLRYDERNCNTQCVACNMFKKGAMDEYALFIIRKYGIDTLHELKRLKNEIKQFTVVQLEELIKKYKDKICQM
jgi:5-methylcytosine-specific restriction endonuclease McrA